MEKVETVHFLFAILLFNIIMHQNLTPMEILEVNKVYLFRLGHMTKTAAMHIFGKNLELSSSPEA